jgi:glycosyltransferase involved in cell wall biosynthesis
LDPADLEARAGPEGSTEPVIGVAIPTLNSIEYLEATLASVQRQRGVRVQLVVADSGSTDGTLEVCAGKGIEVVYVPPGNMYRAINEGIRRLESEWVAYLNSDDVLYTDAYARLLATARATGADVAYGSADFLDEHGRFRYSLRAPAPGQLGLLFDRPLFGFSPHCAIFKRSVFDALGGFSERFRHIADADFYARALDGGSRFAAVAGPAVGTFRLLRSQLSRREAGVAAEERAVFVRERPVRRVRASLAVLRWKLRNGPEYLVRWLRTGRWRGFWGTG